MNTDVVNTNAVLMIAPEGTHTLSAADKELIAHPAVGGVILFSRHFADAAQLRQLCASIRRCTPRSLLITADQEGGRVQRFRGDIFSDIPAAADLYAHGGTTATYDAGLLIAAELRSVGIDLSFAPILDKRTTESQIIGDRAFAADADAIFHAAHAFATGMQHAGMQCCGKHFPGHGSVAADSHLELPIDNRSQDEIFATDLAPFAKWAQHNMPALMTAHVVYAQCDKTAATFSRYWLQTILRNKLHYRGMIISDDLTMAGADIGSMAERMQAALVAGCDGILACHNAADAVTAIDSLTPTLQKEKKSECPVQNPWLSLAPQADGVACIGTPDYKQAQQRIATLRDNVAERLANPNV